MSEVKYVQTESGAVMRETTIELQVTRGGLVSKPVADVPRWFGELPTKGLFQERLFVSTLLSLLVADAEYGRQQSETEDQFQLHTDEARQQIDVAQQWVTSYSAKLGREKIAASSSGGRPTLRPKKQILEAAEQLQVVYDQASHTASETSSTLEQLIELRRKRRNMQAGLLAAAGMILGLVLIGLYIFTRLLIADGHYTAAVNAMTTKDWGKFQQEIDATRQVAPSYRAADLTELEQKALHLQAVEHFDAAELAVQNQDWSRFRLEAAAARQFDSNYRTTDLNNLVNKWLTSTHLDLSGKWDFHIDVHQRKDSDGSVENGNGHADWTIDIKQSEGKLVGSFSSRNACGAGNISGDITESGVSFMIELTSSCCTGIQDIFKGTVSEDGKSLSGSIEPVSLGSSGCSAWYATATGSLR